MGFSYKIHIPFHLKYNNLAEKQDNTDIIAEAAVAPATGDSASCRTWAHLFAAIEVSGDVVNGLRIEQPPEPQHNNLEKMRHLEHQGLRDDLQHLSGEGGEGREGEYDGRKKMRRASVEAGRRT